MNALPALRLEGVSKKYRLFGSPGQRLAEALHPLRRRFHEEFWALRDVSFTLPAGRTLGVLGLNGSGKSTLLQIIAGVLEPTGGTVEVNGRVAALLELGAGFNPDLTGRENVLTNQRIMGLTRADALARMAEIEAFADIGRHFDQPVKTYSSGMFMRVAFAMSICVDPDILIVDEALAVGDSKFQEKCFRRLKEFQAGGRTVLFVTHDRASVAQLCDDAILLHRGELVARGQPAKVVGLYTELLTTGRLPEGPGTARGPAPAAERSPGEDGTEAAATAPADAAQAAEAAFLALASPEDRLAAHPLYNPNEARFGHGGAVVLDALLLVEGRANPAQAFAGAVAEILVRVRFDEAMEPLLGLSLHNAQGLLLYSTHSGWLGAAARPVAPGQLRCYRFRLPLAVAHGPLFLDLTVASSAFRVCDQRARALVVEIARTRMFQGLADLGAAFSEAGPPVSS